MKTSSSFLLSLIAASSLVTAAQAQRESFETSVVRKAEVLILEFVKAETTFHNILFKFDSAEFLNKASEDQVDQIARALITGQFAGTRFRVEGHTCDIGEEDYNLKLSTQRAEVIRLRLIKLGVPAERLSARGFGESELVEKVRPTDSPEQAEARRKKSRRVVMRNLDVSPTGGK
jgi:outer membrane protein OmpA-like peptidoglycan-associated protein